MSLEERRKQKLIKKEGEALTLSVSGSTGAAIDHNYRSEEGTPLHYLREEVGRSRRHRGGGGVKLPLCKGETIYVLK